MTVDGNDVEAMFEATRAARERALAGDGPTLIEARDDADARPRRPRRHEVRAQASRSRSGASATRSTARRSACAQLGVDVDALRAEVNAEIDAAAAGGARRSPMPDPATATDGVFCDGEAEPLGDGQAPWSGFAEGAA